ncbi:MAG: molybdopterin-dependent oxidoreductase [Alphaproteobacteria bacterium]
MDSKRSALTSSHWGAGVVETDGERVTAVHPYPADPAPNRINENIPGALYSQSRIRRPAVRASWLENGPEKRTGVRGRDPFVEVSWDQALDLIAGEIARIREQHGNGSIFAGSYGWSSAGRVHHAQSLLKRFLNTQGGFVRSEGNYSYNAALVLMPYISGPYRLSIIDSTRWSVVEKHSELVLAFGGLAERNTAVCDGGVTFHRFPNAVKACADAGVKFINISPLRSDMSADVQTEWLAPKPGSDTALMMGLAYVLLDEGLHDPDFLARYTVGFDRVAAYLRGQGDDQTPKTPAWAERQSGIPAGRIIDLAREMASKRTLITLAAGLQRADFGEQPLWMCTTLAAMLGQIGLPGGGTMIGAAVNGNIGTKERLFSTGTMRQLNNPVTDFLPVAMIAEMLLHPGESYIYDGAKMKFPDARMVWWAGGNPFHHHQDLARLHAAFQTPETVIVNEISWTAAARHADIVLPVAAAQERLDFGAGKSDDTLVPMAAHAKPPFEARLEYDIYADLAERLGNRDAFTEGKTAEQWAETLWEVTREFSARAGVNLPDFETFMAGDAIAVPDPSPEQVYLADFRADPEANPLPTPSGKLELYSETIAGFGLADCPGQATWFPPRDDPSEHGPLYLISGQPKTRLHSQLDDGAYSRSYKIKDREPVLIHPEDAHSRGIADGDVVELFNGRGRCLAGAVVTDAVRQGCLFLWTGAWYDPDFSQTPPLDRHGNPNSLTHDRRTSSLSQSPASHSVRLDVRKWTGDLPPVQAFLPPAFKR